MRFIARFYLLMWISAFIVIGLCASGCELTVAPPPEPMATDPSCPRGLTHDECVMFKYCTKYPKICAAK